MMSRLSICFLACAGLPAAAAQEPPPAPPVPEQGPPKPEEAPPKEKHGLPPMPGAEDALQKELTELFAKVELRLRAIDTQMYEAASGRIPTKPVVGSGIEELLKAGQSTPPPQSLGALLENTVKDSQQAQGEIQRILEIAEQMNSKSSGSGQGSPKPSSEGSPLDKPGGQRPGEREATPKAPGSKPDAPKPGEGETPQDGKQPDDPNRPTQNSAANPPPAGETSPTSAPNTADRWGDLPVRAREIFRVEGTSDLPPQYRDWIDGYYRRLQSLERR